MSRERRGHEDLKHLGDEVAVIRGRCQWNLKQAAVGDDSVKGACSVAVATGIAPVFICILSPHRGGGPGATSLFLQRGVDKRP